MKQHTVIKNSLITAGILGAATGFCFLIQEAAESDTHVPLLFVLAVLFISRFTDGYIYGIVASMIAVVGVNYVFTYPYFAIDFTITGYPVTFIAMLAVACSVSALTTQIKKQEQIRLEAEKEKMRGNLLRAVSHDIRTPLTSIMGAASVVLENYGELSDEKRMDFLKDIREESQWLIQIVENLLSITRIGDNGGSASIDKQEEMVEEIVGSAVLAILFGMVLCAEIPEALSGCGGGRPAPGGSPAGAHGRHPHRAGAGEPDGEFRPPWKTYLKSGGLRRRREGPGGLLCG